jgi:hypothetical protein
MKRSEMEGGLVNVPGLRFASFGLRWLSPMPGDDMDTCDKCGDEIVFRWVGGAVIPIHVNGGWCSTGSGSKSVYAQSSFVSSDSYLDPNARCPVCGAAVYFYRSPHNGRVFFDDVGWPWPKHRCTDNYQGRDDQILRPVSSRYRFNFKSKEGRSLDVYTVEQVIERENDVLIRLKNTDRRSGRGSQIRVVISISRASIIKQHIEVSDFQKAPSLVLPRDRLEGADTEVSFICARLQAVVVLAAKETGT